MFCLIGSHLSNIQKNKCQSVHWSACGSYEAVHASPNPVYAQPAVHRSDG